MKVSDLLESRQANWRELEQLCGSLEGRSRRRLPAATVARFAALYRAACADLALADAYQLPPGTIDFLHRLVGRAHNQLYRARGFDIRRWTRELFVNVPQRLFTDNYLRLAFLLFWGVFLLSASMAYRAPGFAEEVIGRPMMVKLEEDFSQPISGRSGSDSSGMTGFYIFNNASIGLRCFAFGLFFGIGGLLPTVFNASLLGAVFGHMARLPQWTNFSEFVTAHGPFELMAIVLCAGAGMRLGFSLIDTRGFTRSASLHLAAREVVPTVSAAVLMFIVAALLEGFLSPSAAPYWVKAAAAILSCVVLVFYFVILGWLGLAGGSRATG